uniref:NADH-ubiquinone oxidoreductase chain 4L n=1 Tax=Potamanthellus edmundsi TaxID=2680887 RepID=A0A8K1R9B3_9INSE|nr:NADH dehydrogenase subunit 4L [Potamanthellus edmundsi]
MLTLSYFVLFIGLIFIGMMVFVSNRKHLLATLLSLEFIVLGLYLILFMYLLMKGSELYFLMLFLTFAVCEGALGLSILVSLIRTHGNDFFQSFSVLQC